MNLEFQTFFSAVWLWFGGVLSWFFASFFDYSRKCSRYQDQEKILESLPDEAKALFLAPGAKVFDYIRDQQGGLPSRMYSAVSQAAIPLMVLSFATAATYLLADVAPILKVFSFFGILACLAVTLRHEFIMRDADRCKGRYLICLSVFWGVYLILIMALSASASAADMERRDAPGCAPDVGATIYSG